MMASLEEQLVAEKAKSAELKKVLLQFAEHAIDNEGDDWICSLCGKKEPLETDLKKFPHEAWCPMHPDTM
jgi:hypothetical protein